MLETIAVVLIVALGGMFVVRSIYRTISGKEGKSSCVCGKCTCHTLENSSKSCAAKQRNLKGKEV